MARMQSLGARVFDSSTAITGTSAVPLEPGRLLDDGLHGTEDYGVFAIKKLLDMGLVSTPEKTF